MGAVVSIFSRIFLTNRDDLSESSMSYIISVVDLLRMFFIAQFILACAAIHVRFKALNKELERRKVKASKEIVSKRKLSDTLEMEKVFQKICDCIDIVNETFTFHFVFIFTIVLVNQINFDIKYHESKFYSSL